MVAPSSYVPRRGDIVWLTFNPQAGHEQAGRRPAVVLSPLSYNAKVGLALLCPITSAVKGYPFEVNLPHGLPISGVILADQVRSLDWQARAVEFICALPDTVTQEVLQKIGLLLAE
ncbi:endoribonuclease MazF [Candidatus Amarolinea aalborgensis]|uniref:endoribonuclease MazF n=1 Tax=Candidatus Amarolinea aalborgensis TaxID=2249329 RepID=UPI003BF97567